MEGTLNQPYVALLCIYLGMAGMLLYCALRRTCALLHLGKAGKWLSEGIFCLSFAGLCAWVFYRLLALRLRVFYLFGLLLGALLYYFGVHRLLHGILNRICRAMRKKVHK